ncbi:putative quinol monooxygenase [Sphingomonas sp. Leaf25]|uniref:putative quinol monooxygenase n=1 Tax=Sphingomonas sp. Leaf25 TaxID=1735692 RepID=UPI0006FEB392|nr:antibiotic biosynthesis monooxygenase [Sphingomonas sp. Leaf25]KQM97993.1 hypothetical protein ASE78_06895 [Sphingomonas sp. Leaf25]
MIGLIVTHRAQAGQRASLVDAWERHMPSAISANPGHVAYSYGLGDDPDAIIAVQIYRSPADAEEFLRTDAYREYLDASRHLLAHEPELTRFTPHWIKGIA